MTQTLPRLIVLAALVLEGAVPARAAPPKNPPLPPARPAFPDDPPVPADPNAGQVGAEGFSQQAGFVQGAAQYAANPPASNGPFGALFAPSQTAFAPPPPAAPPPDDAPPQPSSAPAQSASLRSPPVAAGPADYPEAPVDRSPGQEEAVAGFAIAERAGLADMTRKYARQHGIPLALLHRIIMRERKYCPRLVNHTYYGLMQIRRRRRARWAITARPRACSIPRPIWPMPRPISPTPGRSRTATWTARAAFASGYYYTAKSKHMLSQMRDARSPRSSRSSRPSPKRLRLLAWVGHPWLFAALVCYVLLCYGGGFGTMPSFVLVQL